MMGFGLILPILLIALLAYALGWLPRRPANGQGGPQSGTNAVDILRQRYARGEIDREQFERMVADLRRT
ncbi:MAG TPA: SHOCT domain-containing protein [Anaerolineales bacterium]|jgi:putative membrane protein